jgi:tellurite resistance protein TerC
MATIGTPIHWIGFTAFVLLMLALDLGVFHRSAKEVRPGEALTWTFVWITIAGLFGAGVYHFFGREPALEYFTSYVIEKSLSVDNVFVFIVLFGSFAIPAKQQHRVLFWGVLGALLMRGAFIAVGAAVLHRFHWVTYPLGAFLLITGIRMLRGGGDPDPTKNPLFTRFRRAVRSLPELHGSRFTLVKEGKRYATPLLLALVAIELTDVVFALDSIPAIFAVTDDPFIIYTSNIFALLGLRSLYFAVAGAVAKFHYLKVGLSLVLTFIGTKMVIAGVYKIGIVASLTVVCGLILASIIASLLIKPRDAGLRTAT